MNDDPPEKLVATSGGATPNACAYARKERNREMMDFMVEDNR
jgi:hypothetical protein